MEADKNFIYYFKQFSATAGRTQPGSTVELKTSNTSTGARGRKNRMRVEETT
jgi:hypothetical protein